VHSKAFTGTAGLLFEQFPELGKFISIAFPRRELPFEGIDVVLQRSDPAPPSTQQPAFRVQGSGTLYLHAIGVGRWSGKLPAVLVLELVRVPAVASLDPGVNHLVEFALFGRKFLVPKATECRLLDLVLAALAHLFHRASIAVPGGTGTARRARARAAFDTVGTDIVEPCHGAVIESLFAWRRRNDNTAKR